MTIVFNGTTGIETPGVTNSGSETIAGTLQVGGVTTNIYPLVSGTAVTASGTSVNFTDIPSTAKRVMVMFSGISTSGTSALIVQLGTGATPTYTTTGYIGQASAMGALTTAMSTGFIANNNMIAANTQHGLVTICNVSSNIWAESGNVACQNATNLLVASGGSISLAAALTAVRITTVNGTDTFDAGSINIMYE